MLVNTTLMGWERPLGRARPGLSGRNEVPAVTGSMFPAGLRPDGLPAALSDPRRIAAVRATGLLDTPPEQPFDDLTGLAATITGCERAFITLVDEDRTTAPMLRRPQP